MSRRNIRRTREQNIDSFKKIIDCIITDDEFFCDGITKAEKDMPEYLMLISPKDVCNVEIKLHKIWQQFKKNEK